MARTRNGRVAGWVQWAIVVALTVIVGILAEARLSGRDSARLHALEKWHSGERLIRVEKDIEYIKSTLDEVRADVKTLKEK